MRFNFNFKLNLQLSYTFQTQAVFQHSWSSIPLPHFGMLGFILLTETLVRMQLQRHTHTHTHTETLVFCVSWIPCVPRLVTATCYSHYVGNPHSVQFLFLSNTNSRTNSDTYIMIILIHSVTNVASITQITIL